MKTTSKTIARFILAGTILWVLQSSVPAQTPSFQWAKRVASTLSPDDELAIGLAVDNAANLYVTGWFDGTNDFGGATLTNDSGGGQDIFVAKYNSDGALQWARRAGGNTADWDAGRGVGVDNAGNVYVTGGFWGTADFGSISRTVKQPGDFFLAKYDSNGNVQWVSQSEGGGHEAYGNGIAVDNVCNSYIVGYFDGDEVTFGTTTLTNTGDYGAFLVKYNSSGTPQWARPITGAGTVYSTKVALDSSGNVYLGGNFTVNVTIGTSNFVSASGKDLFIAKFNSGGSFQWARHVGGTGDDSAESGVAVDAAGNVFISGFYESSPLNFAGTTLTNAGSWDAFIAKYNNAGTLQWVQRAGGTNADWLVDVSTDGQSNAYAAGLISGTASFDTNIVTCLSGYDVVVVKYDADGAMKWVTTAGGTNNDLAFRTVVDAFGNCYLAGWFQNTAIFGTNTLTGKGYWDFFLAKLASGSQSNAPSITVQPQSSTNVIGTTATFNVTVIGTAPLAYQWRKDGANLANGGNYSGVSTNYLTIGNVQFTNAGNYIVVVTNAYGSVTSSIAMLVVTSSPASDFTYITNNGNITITGYTGSGGNVVIPSAINGLPVSNIGDYAFSGQTGLTRVTIPNSVTNIGSYAFQNCTSLTSLITGSGVATVGYGAIAGCISLSGIVVDPLNPLYSSVDGVVFNKNQTILLQFPIGKAGSYTVPNSVTSIGDWAFLGCTKLTSITLGNSATNIGAYSFDSCTSLTGFYFRGNAPSITTNSFSGDLNATVYYLPGTTGWGSTYGGRPTALWYLPNPLILANNGSFGMQANRFGFTISWATNSAVVVEASTNLQNWTPLLTNTLVNGTNTFSDSTWTNYPRRFYRIRSP